MPVIKKVTNGASIAGAINYAQSNKVREETIQWLESSGADPELIELAKKSRAIFTDGVRCDPSDAKNEMIQTRHYFGHGGYKNQVSRSVFSFSKDEVDSTDPQQLLHALDYVSAVIEKAYPTYESFLALHIDGKSHLAHVHVITNKVNMETGKVMNFAYGQQQELLRSLNDAMCKDFGYTVPEKTSTLAPERYTAKELKSLDQGVYDPRVYIKQRLDDALLDPSVSGLDQVQAKLAEPQQNSFTQPDESGALKQDRLAVEVRANKTGALTYVIHHLDVESSRKRKPGAPAREWVERVHASTLGSVYSIDEMTNFIEGRVTQDELQRQTDQHKEDERIIDSTIADSAPNRTAIEETSIASDDATPQEPGHDETHRDTSDGANELREDDQSDSIDDPEDSGAIDLTELVAASNEQVRADRSRLEAQARRSQDLGAEPEDTTRSSDQGASRGAGVADSGYRQTSDGSDGYTNNVELDPTSFEPVRTTGQRRAKYDDVWAVVEPDRGRREADSERDVFSGGYARKSPWPTASHKSAFSKLIYPAMRATSRVKAVLHSFEEGLARARERAAQAAQRVTQFIKDKQHRDDERKVQQDQRERVAHPEVLGSERDQVDEEIAASKRQASWSVLADKNMAIRDKYDHIRSAYGQPPVTDKECQTVYQKHRAWRKLDRPFALTTTQTPLGPLPSGEYGKVVFNYDSLVQQGLAPKMSSEAIAKQENSKRRKAKYTAQRAFQVALVGLDALNGGGSTGGQPAARVPGAKTALAKVASSEKTGERTAPEHGAESMPEPSAPHDLPGN
ncbi:relaxase/mobilization nuclease domain-containing protein [Lacticaseibacillus jixiensis]|uniref:relaxase/mobilization nuclease domain-containing protein n=1 Tax=Lacticaseibacillus jixiensis TaxID=3231926 RepID=UPI0036F37FB4